MEDDRLKDISQEGFGSLKNKDILRWPVLQESPVLEEALLIYSRPGKHRNAILTELDRRRHAESVRPHWTAHWTFWATVVGALAAIAAAVFAGLTYFRPIQ